MGLRAAQFDSAAWDHGWVLYESVSMTAYPGVFRSQDDAWAFVAWHTARYSQDIIDPDLEQLYERFDEWIQETWGNPLPIYPATQPFRHGPERNAFALGVCGHWWQDRQPGMEHMLLTDCPRCHRPPSHIFSRVRQATRELWEIVMPPGCKTSCVAEPGQKL